VGDVEAALDLTQETFIRAYRAIGATEPGLLVRPWLYRIATNLAHDYLRRRRRFTWLPLQVLDRLTGGHEMNTIEARMLVRQALARLQPEERTILLLCGLERLTYAEAAAVLGGSAEAARKRFGRAKGRFRLAYREVSGDVAP
jgi:RNA polymerase sigma-70 factor, ECF subfamily